MKIHILIFLFFTCYLQIARAQEMVVYFNQLQERNNDSVYYFNGKLYNGEAIKFDGEKFEKTKLRYDGHFADGRRNGTIKSWYSNYKIEYIENYSLGIKNGDQTAFYDNGNLKIECTYKNGKKEGVNTDWFENGQKEHECNYADEIIDGTSTDWYDNGQIKSIYKYFLGNIVDGTYTSYFQNGQIEKEEAYVNGIVTKVSSYDNGKLLKTRELHVEFFSNGQKKTEYWQVDGKKDGYFIQWYDNGQKDQEGYFENGTVNGKFASWFKNGEKRSEGSSINGKKNGICTFWDENGKVLGSGNYVDDKIQGELTYDDKNKASQKSAYFKDGELDYYSMNTVKNFQFPENSNLMKIRTVNNKGDLICLIIQSDGNDNYSNRIINSIKELILTKTRFIDIQSSDYDNYKNDTITRFLYVTLNLKSQNSQAKENQTGNLITVYKTSVSFAFNIKDYKYKVIGIDGAYKESNFERSLESSINGAYNSLYTTVGFGSSARSEFSFDALKDFIYKYFTIQSSVKDIVEKGRNGDATIISIEGGTDIGIFKDKRLFTNNLIFKIYNERKLDEQIGLIKIKEITDSSTICKVKEGGDLITSLFNSGVKLIAISSYEK